MSFYRLLLHLYPSSFRSDYEGELAAVFEERARSLGSFRLALAALADVIPNAIATHWDLLVQDLRFAVRSLRRSPGFAITALLVTALGVGANTAAFSLADFVLLRPLPLKEPQRLLKIWQSNPTGWNEFSPANYRDMKEQARSFEGMGAYTTRATNLVGTGDPRRLEAILATPDVLPLLGVPALLGRHFTARDAATERPVMLTYALWQSQFGGDRNIAGRVVRLDGEPHTVIGVMPASFQFPRRGIDAWTALTFREEDMEDRSDTYLEVVARLRNGVPVTQGRKELEVIAARLEKQYPENAQTGVRTPLLHEEVSQSARLLVLALCGAALCILLLSCANLASLFLARGAHRARELAVRSALGAGRERLVRQLVTESFTIAFLGGLAGVGLAAASIPLLARLVPSTLPIAEYPSVDLRVLGLAAVLMVLTGLAFGVLPAVRSGRGTDLKALHAGARSASGGRTQRVRAALVIVEIVASVVLLISSGLLIRAVWNIQATEPGFRAGNVLTLRTALPLPKYEKVARRAQFYTQVLDEVRALPGVKSAAFVTGLPMEMRGGIWSVSIGGVEAPRDGSNDVSLRFVTPQFFSTLQIPLLRGRDVAEGDANEPYAAVVSESFAKQHWPGQDPIGKRFKVANFDRTIVGVSGDVRVRGREQSSEPQVYLPYRQVPDGGLIGYVPKVLAVRTSGAPDSLMAPITSIIRRADPEQPVSNVRTLSAIVEEETAPRVTQVRLLGAMAAIALLIAGIGIHGLLAYSVSRRLPELGVRRALGAQVSGIVGLVVREGIVLAAIGIVVGMFLAWFAARGMGALLAGIRPEDPFTFAAASLLCFLTVLAGCLRPALRAAHVDPMTALRAD